MDGLRLLRNDEGPYRLASGRTVRILVMDDLPVVRMGVHAMVESAHGLEIVGATHDGAVSSHDIQELAPDVIVVNSLSLSKERLDQVRHLTDHSRLATRILMIVG